MAETWYHLNANPQFKVRLTPKGQQILNDFGQRTGMTITYDNHGHTQLSFWLLQHLFGLCNGRQYEIEDLWILITTNDKPVPPPSSLWARIREKLRGWRAQWQVKHWRKRFHW